MEQLTGRLAVSKAGHDAGSIYVILTEDESFVYLADGRLKPVSSPKKKNKRHIQIIKKEPEIGFFALVSAGKAQDADIRRVLRKWSQSKDSRQEVEDVQGGCN